MCEAGGGEGKKGKLDLYQKVAVGLLKCGPKGDCLESGLVLRVDRAISSFTSSIY